MIKKLILLRTIYVFLLIILINQGLDVLCMYKNEDVRQKNKKEY